MKPAPAVPMMNQQTSQNFVNALRLLKEDQARRALQPGSPTSTQAGPPDPAMGKSQTPPMPQLQPGQTLDAPTGPGKLWV